MELKEKITKLRRMKGLSQSELAVLVGVTCRSIQNYEAGSRYPKKDVLAKIAEALDVEEKKLVSEEEEFIIEANDKYGSRGQSAAEHLVSNANALFAGGDITEDDKAKVLEAIQEAYWQAKLINKKYTPKKYRNNNND